MDPLPTLDVLLNDPATGKDRLTRAVESAVTAALAELAAIEAFDAASAPTQALWFDRPAATAVRALYEAWVGTAEGLQARAALAIARAGPMVGTDKLEYAVGKTVARLSITLDDMEESVRDGIEGRVTRFASVEEMRRELLRPVVSRPGTGAVPSVEPMAAGGGA